MMDKTTDKVRVHRFNDSVAFHAEGMTETIYLTPRMAAQLAEAIQLFTKDISCVKYTDSMLHDVAIEKEH